MGEEATEVVGRRFEIAKAGAGLPHSILFVEYLEFQGEVRAELLERAKVEGG